mmetsp:Transcript_25024/g.30793  ORF Transcript_25024/g.30793 Transcript_25024/m.30793 type:complete len:82 (+) Transcript_25024:824-1069(+)
MLAFAALQKHWNTLLPLSKDILASTSALAEFITLAVFVSVRAPKTILALTVLKKGTDTLVVIDLKNPKAKVKGSPDTFPYR